MDYQQDTFVDTWEYAVRVIAHSISHLNRGACALVLYRLSDPYWTQTGWGFMRPTQDGNFETKPVYDAVKHTLKTLPKGSTILAPDWYTHDDPHHTKYCLPRERSKLPCLGGQRDCPQGDESDSSQQKIRSLEINPANHSD